MFHSTPYPADARPVGVKALLEAATINGPMRKGAKRFWTTTELKTLRSTYPAGGIEACIAALPGRSASSIYQRAAQEGLRKKNSLGGITERHTWTTTPQIDAAIIKLFTGTPKLDGVKRLAQTIGRPRSWISTRARVLGVAVPRFKELPWSEVEFAILREHGGKHPDTVRRLLMKAGFKRTSVAISLQAKRLKVSREVDDNIYTARGMALALGIDSSAINTWISRGWLKARKRKVLTGDPDKGAWDIHRRDIRTFIIENVGVVDFRKLDKVWLVELLSEYQGNRK